MRRDRGRARRQEQQSAISERSLGVDSTAILLRWLTEPSSRDFPLHNLIVITAMTGNEWSVTGQMVTIGKPRYHNVRSSWSGRRLRRRVWDIAVADGDRISTGWSIPKPVSTAAECWLWHAFRDRAGRLGHGLGVLAGSRPMIMSVDRCVDQGTGAAGPVWPVMDADYWSRGAGRS